MVTTRSGRRLTEADLQRLADEIESEDFDISTRKPWPGHGRLGLRTTPRKRISVRVPAVLHCHVNAKATADGRSVSEVGRNLLEDYVATAEDR
ncbi:MAG: hypothetical protein FIA92_01625 [Chloroflexi bacterium]|nr:hypothetical protein [Chloroflexota bacterium]